MNLEENVHRIKTKIHDSYHKRLMRLGVREDQFNPRDPDDDTFKKAKAAIEALMEHDKDYSEARKDYLDEITFTLFNRLAGIKVMEAESRQLVPEIIQRRAKHGDKSFAHNVWLEENSDKTTETLEGLNSFIRDKFNELSDNLPLYSSDYPYDIMPEVHDLKDIITLYNEEISLEDWVKDDILGWLYEAYNKKDYQEFKDSGDKIEWDKLSLSSQMYTPRWIVEFLVDNSLGKYWLEINPVSKIKDNHDIANAPEDPVLDYKNIEEVKLIDPACGSGNFLLYAFDLLSEIYEEEGYNQKKIPSKILASNLYGLDIDERSVQIARLQLYIKAKTYSRNTELEDINVVSSNFHLPEFDKVKDKFSMNFDFAPNEEDFLEELWNELRDAHKFGSLLTLDEKLSKFFEEKKSADSLGLFDNIKDVDNLEVDILDKLKEVFSKTINNGYSSNFIKHQSLDAVKFAEIMLGVNKDNGGYEVEKYDIAVANPPYTDSGNYGKELKDYVNNNYKKPVSFHKNLYACFLKKNSDFINEQGKIAMIHPLTFMYISSYEDMREFILEDLHINIFVDFGLERNTFMGVMVDPAFYVLEKNNQTDKSLFIRVNQYTRTKHEKFKKKYVQKALLDYTNETKNKHNFELAQNKLKIINGYPFIYWISDSFREKFAEKQLGDILDVRQGVATSNNLRFLRFWWEVDEDKISVNYEKDKKKWVPYQKGGEYKKWYGNNWLVLKYDRSAKKYLSNNGNNLPSKKYYFKEGITYTDASAKGTSFRYIPSNNIFDVSGSCIFSNNDTSNLYYNLGLLNTSLAEYITSALNASVHTQVGDMKRVPFVKPDKDIEKSIVSLSQINIQEKKKQYVFDIVEREFEFIPLNYNWDKDSLNVEQRMKNYVEFKYNSECKILINEAIIDEIIFDVYDLTDSDREMVLDQEGTPEGLYPVLEIDRDNYLKNNQDELENEVADFINNLSIETDRSRANLKDNIKKPYKKNKSVKEISNELELNPISVVEIIKEFDFSPKKLSFQKAHEFMLDLSREILMENEDGIVIVNEYAGEDPLDKKIENKLYDKGFSSGDIKRLEDMLGKSIKDYLLSDLFSDECDTLNLFMFQPKTPFIWHLSSGKEHGFDAYIIIYRWNRDKILKIKSYYIDKRRAGLNNRLSNLANDDSASAEKEKDKIRKQLDEIKDFESKLDELLSSGYDPELDDGVGKNIAPLQDLGLLADDVLTKSQLKKFLNADW